MIDIKVIAKNLVKEAVESTVTNQIKKEGRPATATNLSMKAGVGTNVDQLWLRCKRGLARIQEKEQELDRQIEDAINANVQRLDSDEYDDDTAVEIYTNGVEQIKNSKLYNDYLMISGSVHRLEKAIEEYEQDHAANNGITSREARAKLKDVAEPILLAYDTEFYNKALAKAKDKLAAMGIHGADQLDPENKLDKVDRNIKPIEVDYGKMQIDM